MGSTIFDAIIVVAAWIGGGLITYGIMKAKIMGLESAMNDVKKEIESCKASFLPRIEYDNRHADLLRGMDRIEKKVDRIQYGESHGG